MNLTRVNWPKGWNPSEDPVNGDPNALVRADNLYLDELGVLSLTKGLRKVNQSALPDYPSDILAKQVGSNEAIWAGLNQNGATIVRSAKGDFSDTAIIGSGSSRCILGDALGNVLALAGVTRLKDNGSVTKNLGLATPGTPKASINELPAVAFGGDADSSGQHNLVLVAPMSWQVLTVAMQTYGTIIAGASSSFVTMEMDPVSMAASAFSKVGKIDTLNINGQPSTDPSQDNIQFEFTPGAGSAIDNVVLAFVLDANPFSDTNSTFTDAYVYGWGDVTVDSDGVTGGNNNVTFNLGQNNTFNVPRKNFKRVGSDATKGWDTVSAIYIFVQATNQSTFFNAGRVLVCGGQLGQLNGIYQYIQFNINDNGVYQAKSPASVATPPIQVINGSTVLSPGSTDSQTTLCQFYRISVAPTDGSQPTSFLNQYFFVGSCAPGGTFTDETSDDTALEINQPANLFLQTMLATDPNGLTDTIYGVEGLFFERMFYMGLSFIYISDSLNPDAIDKRYTLKPSGDPSEKNLWIRRITNNVLILGTSKNLYELSGDMETLPDGTLNINFIPIGEAYPPLTTDCTNIEGNIFYVAADGIRVTSGSNSTKISGDLDLLFQGQTRGGVPPVAIIPLGMKRYSISAGKSHLYVILPLQDGSVRLFVYHFKTQNWRIIYTDPYVVYTTPTDKVLLGYNDTVDPSVAVGDIFQADIGQGVQDTSGNILEGMPITLLTVFDANGQPRNRKDTFTLKLIMDTGGRAVTVALGKDNGTLKNLGNYTTNGLTTVYIPLNNAADNFGVTLGFRYALQITDTNLLTTFKLYEYTIEYEARPEQVDYLRILPSNLGTISRKRITAFAFVIDTLGNPITFQPLLDNVAWSVQGTVNNPTKLTYIFYFLSEAIATDIGGILYGGVFEFYSINLEECISEKLPTPVEFLVIPANNYGIPNRKRHTSYKFQILTRGANVQFTPILDGVSHQPATFNTTIKKTVEYFFPQSDGDVIGIDIGGLLASIASPQPVPFEFYGVITPQQIEQLPDRLEYLRIPNNNFGIPARKRLRTLPMVIDTYGQNVTFTPIVDGVLQGITTVFNTSGKTTVYHYFVNDVFGTDFGGILQDAQEPFEFYGMETPEDVEALPVPKQYDQLGPMRFDKIGKLFGFRIRLIPLPGLTSLPYAFYGDNSLTNPTYSGSPLYSGTISLNPGSDNAYEIFLPKNVNTNIVRLVLGPTSIPFHRYDVTVKVQTSGMESDSQWMPIK